MQMSKMSADGVLAPSGQIEADAAGLMPLVLAEVLQAAVTVEQDTEPQDLAQVQGDVHRHEVEPAIRGQASGEPVAGV